MPVLTVAAAPLAFFALSRFKKKIKKKRKEIYAYNFPQDFRHTVSVFFFFLNFIEEVTFSWHIVDIRE